MWLRFVLPVNRNLSQSSLISILNGNVHKSLPFHRFKHVAAGGVVNRDSHNQNKNGKLNGKRDPFRDEATKGALFTSDDPDVFGAFNKHVTEPDEIDEGDAADDAHYSNIPLRRDQLRQRRYEDMITKHLRNKQFKEAIDILEVRMKEDRVKPDYYVYELLIIECGRYGYTKKAFQLYNRMKKRGLRVSGPIYAALFNACANTIHPVEGLELAENLRKIIIQIGYEPNEIIYNAMIKAFGRCGDINTAFQLVDEMKEKALRLKIDTMNHLLQVCCSEKEFGFRHALLVWHKIYRQNLAPTVHSFNLMLRCTRDCGIGDVEQMEKVIAAILRGSKTAIKLKSNKESKEILLIQDKPKAAINPINHEDTQSLEDIDANLKSKRELTTKEVCDQLPNLLSKLPHLGSIVRLSLVNTPAERFMLLGGLSLFITEMEQAKVRPNVKTFSQLMDNIPSTRDAEHELIQKMRYMRVRADIDFFNLLMKRRIFRKDYDGAKQVLELIQKVNLDPDIVTYGVMAMGCIDRHQAQQFQQKLSEKGVRLNNEILGALLKNASYIKDYEYVIDVLKYAMNEDIKPSSKFNEILSKFKNSRFHSLQSNDDDQEQIKYNAFYTVYKKWQEQMGLDGLKSRDEATRSLRVHPWKQLKEGEGEGIEPVKNMKTRRYWKVQHALVKLTPARFDRLQGQNTEKLENIETMEKVEDK